MGTATTTTRTLATLAILIVTGAAACDREDGQPESTATRVPASVPSDTAPEAAAASPSFTDITDAVGLDFVHDPCIDGSYWQPENTGGGAALLDYDNDGDLDVYLVNGAPHGRAATTAATKPAPRNALYRQDAGPRFVDVTDAAGVGGNGAFGVGVTTGDYDNDGHVDLYVTTVGRDALFHNNGDGTFADVTDGAGIAETVYGASAAFFDYDLDGDLDLYVTTYLDLGADPKCSDASGRRDYCGPQFYKGVPDLLYRNNGDGTFADVSAAAGIAAVTSKSLGVAVYDFNNDNRPDVFVANDEEPNELWINRGDGTFSNDALAWGAAYDGSGRAGAGMGVAVGDVENDGDFDLYITHLGLEVNLFYRLMDHARVQDDTIPTGLANRPPHTGWGTVFFDYDHDGDEDLAVVNGRIARGPVLVKRPPGEPAAFSDPYAEPNLLFENTGGGRFRDARGAAGPFGAHVEWSHGLAAGDIDNDGDVDLLVTNTGAKPRLYRNDRGTTAGRWLAVRAVDPATKRDAIGAVVAVVTGDGQSRHRLIHPARSYASAGDVRAHVGLGDQSRVERIDVRWPDGTRETFPGGASDRLVTVEKGRGTAGSAS